MAHGAVHAHVLHRGQSAGLAFDCGRDKEDLDLHNSMLDFKRSVLLKARTTAKRNALFIVHSKDVSFSVLLAIWTATYAYAR